MPVQKNLIGFITICLIRRSFEVPVPLPISYQQRRLAASTYIQDSPLTRKFACSDLNMASNYSPKHFKVTFPREYVAHIEINRPNQLNAFFEA